MEVALCAQEACHHAVLLLEQLNLQRKKNQFCDCVLRQKDNLAQLHPAHRCVLAASSPVLASIMSSTGVVVELQAPCLSDCVLAALLDYVYTGSLSHAQSQQQHHSLLTVASYLQMEELMEALQAWQHPQMEFGESADAPTDHETQTNKDVNMETSVQNVPTTLEVDGMNKELSKDPSVDIVKPEMLQRPAENELVGMNEGSSASSQPRWCGAVPVICHSSNVAAVLRMAEVSVPESQMPLSSSRAPVLRLTSRDNNCTVESITTTDLKEQHGSQNQEAQRHDINHTVTQGQFHKEELNQSAAQNAWKHQFTRDYNSSNLNTFKTQANEYQAKGLAYCHPCKSQHPYCSPLQTTTENLEDDSLLQNKETDVSIYDFPLNYKQDKKSEGYSVSVRTPTEENLPHLKDTMSLPVGGNDSNCEDFCPERGVKKEHSYCSNCPPELDAQDSQCNFYRPKKKWLSNICWAETAVKDIQHDYVSEETLPAADNKGTTILSKPVSNTSGLSRDNITADPFWEHRTSIKLEKTITMSMDSSTSDTGCSEVGQLYSGHVHYHFVPPEDTSCDHQRSQEHSHEEGNASFTSSDPDPFKRHFVAETRDQVLLLDIHTKPAELLVSYRHTSDGEEEEEEEEEVDGQSCRFETELAKVELSRPGVEVTQGVEVSCPQRVQNQIHTRTVCSPPSVSDSVQALIPSTSFASVPSTLSASMDTDKSTHLSTLVNHPFQCTLCDRSFSQRGSLNRHVRSHLGVRPFSCPRCPMTFSRQYRVTEHMRVHQRCVLDSDFPNPSNSDLTPWQKDREESFIGRQCL